MNLERDGRIDVRQHDPYRPATSLPCGGLVTLLEIVVATTLVVGFFGGVSQPFGWASVAQFLLCASLGVLLWLADARLAANDSVAVEGDDAYWHHHPARRETSSSY